MILRIQCEGRTGREREKRQGEKLRRDWEHSFSGGGVRRATTISSNQALITGARRPTRRRGRRHTALAFSSIAPALASGPSSIAQAQWEQLTGLLSDLSALPIAPARTMSGPAPRTPAAGARSATSAPLPTPAPLPRKIYAKGEVDRNLLKARFREVFQKEAFSWQIDEAVAVYEGHDVILDVGTGSGKTFCAALPLLLHKDDIGLVVSPISALMIDQVCSHMFDHNTVSEGCPLRQTLLQLGNSRLLPSALRPWSLQKKNIETCFRYVVLWFCVYNIVL
jgi:hypothetical protein